MSCTLLFSSFVSPFVSLPLFVASTACFLSIYYTDIHTTHAWMGRAMAMLG